MALELDSGLFRPFTIFVLKPLNDRAREIVDHPVNSHLVSAEGEDKYLCVGCVPSNVNDGVTLATLGRHGDIYIEGSSVARVQCSFEMEPASKMVMLYDKSHNNSTQVHAPKSDDRAGAVASTFPFEYGRPRKVLVSDQVNFIVGMCGVRRDLILFRIHWSQTASAVLVDKTRRYEETGLAHVAHLAKTLDDTETAPETTRVTRIHTPALGNTMLLRYYVFETIGAGSFGIVSRVVNVDTGRVMALKQLKKPSVESQAQWETRQREAKILANIDHPFIIDLIWSQHWDRNTAEIFLGLKDGSFQGLLDTKAYATSQPPMSLEDLVKRMFNHMLQALDALACAGVVHRDVKPENILYVRRDDGAYHFLLSDFGLSNTAHMAISTVGTAHFIAPEVYNGSWGRQSPKADVWSLLVTLLWSLDRNGFFARCIACKSHNEVVRTVQKHVADPYFASVRAMAAVQPEHRASAAQMLCALYDGQGLVTPRNRVPPLATPPRPATPATPAAPTPTVQAVPAAASPPPQHPDITQTAQPALSPRPTTTISPPVAPVEAAAKATTTAPANATRAGLFTFTKRPWRPDGQRTPRANPSPTAMTTTAARPTRPVDVNNRVTKRRAQPRGMNEDTAKDRDPDGTRNINTNRNRNRNRGNTVKTSIATDGAAPADKPPSHPPSSGMMLISDGDRRPPGTFPA